jgi:hypothetical protein
MAKTTILNLAPTAFKLLVNVEKEDEARLVLLGNTRLKHRESGKLATEEDFDKLDGVLRLVEHEGEEPTNDNPTGWLYYTPEIDQVDFHHKATYTIDVKLPKARFEALLTAVNQGRLPSEISITIAGMSYDWQPDGSGKIWDNKNNPQIPIRAMFFIVPLVGPDPLDFLDDRNAEDTMPPSRAQLNQVISDLAQLRGKLESMSWLLILLTFFLAAIVCHYH